MDRIPKRRLRAVRHHDRGAVVIRAEHQAKRTEFPQLAGQDGIAHHPPYRIAAWPGFLEPVAHELVANRGVVGGCLVHGALVHGPPLLLVAVEQVFASPALERGRQLPA